MNFHYQIIPVPPSLDTIPLKIIISMYQCWEGKNRLQSCPNHWYIVPLGAERINTLVCPYKPEQFLTNCPTANVPWLNSPEMICVCSVSSTYKFLQQQVQVGILWNNAKCLERKLRLYIMFREVRYRAWSRVGSKIKNSLFFVLPIMYKIVENCHREINKTKGCLNSCCRQNTLIIASRKR